ncbi:hypothetical protein BGZ65_001181 [Modicella reniformis]|uniref:Uncharacterized protein n=1 Tax=Modicella reniformis TaxID=1440133 RepID=A0A9P6MA01_9FUNG|nr:hypothetical protein BGZ65_001181 [Modicella reniformis]
MATETVIYVSLALVLLTRIYVFINPPEFLEEHKDRRTYHEYHLYRQYHLHKQYDKNEQEQGEDELDSSQSFTSRQRSTSASEEKGEYLNTSLLEGLHHPSDELILLGREPGVPSSFALHELSTHNLSKLETNKVSSPTSLSSPSPTTTTTTTATTTITSPTTPLSPQQEGQHAIWDQILGSNAADPVPNYISLDISEIHYNGSLEKFDQDPEVLESIRELKAGQRDMAKECPTMTMIWEGVTEDYWKASGMAMVTRDMVIVSPPTSTVESVLPRLVDSKTTTNSSSSAAVAAAATDLETNISNDHQGQMSITADTNVITVGLSLDRDRRTGSMIHKVTRAALSPKAQFRRKVEGCILSPGSLGGHDADDEQDLEEEEVESDGYLEDDEGDEDDFEEKRLGALDLSKMTVTPTFKHHQSLKHYSERRKDAVSVKYPLYLQKHLEEEEKDCNASDLTMAAPRSPPPMLPNGGRDLTTTMTNQESKFYPRSMHQHYLGRKAPFGSVGGGDDDDLRGNNKISSSYQGQHQYPQQRTKLQQHQLNLHHHHHHERKISIPDFMLPPPLHDEQPFVIADASTTTPTREKNPPRRDSGHGDSS